MAYNKSTAQLKATGKAQVSFQSGPTGRVMRLTDPEVKTQVNAVIADITSSKAKATDFLKRVGILTPSGKISQKYGG